MEMMGMNSTGHRYMPKESWNRCPRCGSRFMTWNQWRGCTMWVRGYNGMEPALKFMFCPNCGGKLEEGRSDGTD